jgi:hypothetical protein
MKTYLIHAEQVFRHLPFCDCPKYNIPLYDSIDIYEKRNFIFLLSAEDAIEIKLKYPLVEIHPNF